jgi:hypothetical protein
MAKYPSTALALFTLFPLWQVSILSPAFMQLERYTADNMMQF